MLKKFDDKYRRKPKMFTSFLVCEKCGFVTARTQSMRTHKATCKGPKIASSLQCDLCGLKFRIKCRLRQHVQRLHSKRETSTCNSCNHEFGERSNYLRHIKRILKGPAYKCTACSQEFKCLEAKELHVKVQHKEGFKCELCPYIGRLRKHIQKHKLSHSKPHSCETCGNKFTLPSLLKQHQIFYKHGVYETRTKADKSCFKCDFCGKSFLIRELLRLHLNCHLKVSCGICKKKVNKANLKFHLNSYHVRDLRVHECKFCTLKFKSVKAVTLHNRNRHPNGEFGCKQGCMQKFAKLEDLQEHEKFHIGRQQWKCFQCKFIAHDNRRLKTHVLNVHGEGLSFQCDFCGKKYKSKSAVKGHIVAKHKH